MNSKFAVLTALVAGFLPLSAMAQAPAAAAPAAPAAAAQPKLPPPTAFPAKIALVNFQEAVVATNEGQRAAMDVAKRYQPQKDKLDALGTEVDSLKKQMQSAPATMTDEERNRRLKEIDTKDKQYQRDLEDANNSYQSDLNDALSKVAEKIHDVMLNYLAKNGYTLLLNYGDQQSSPIMWATQDQNADITGALVEAYNASSGVAAPPPAAPAAGATTRRPAAGATHPSTTTHPAAPTK